MRIGVISDTHDHLDPAALQILRQHQVEHILHAGDIGNASILHQLSTVAPVTAVLGNNDFSLDCREFEAVTLANHAFFLQHIVRPENPDPTLRKRLLKFQPRTVIFGHTHRAEATELHGILFLNPGYAGKPRFNQPRSLAILNIQPHPHPLLHTFITLPDVPAHYPAP